MQAVYGNISLSCTYSMSTKVEYVFLTTHDRKQTALMYAALNGHLDVVTLLVNHGADISAKNECVTSLTLHFEFFGPDLFEKLGQDGFDVLN